MLIFPHLPNISHTFNGHKWKVGGWPLLKMNIDTRECWKNTNHGKGTWQIVIDNDNNNDNDNDNGKHCEKKLGDSQMSRLLEWFRIFYKKPENVVIAKLAAKLT